MPELDFPIEVVLADDHPIVLDGLRSLVGRDRRFRVVAEVRDGPSALEAITRLKPHLAVLDYAMPRLSGMDVLRRLRGDGSTTRVVLLTASTTPALLAEAKACPPDGMLFKDAAADELIGCIAAVAAGEVWFGASARAELSNLLDGTSSPDAQLTPRERELVLLVAEGLQNKVIARRLGLSDGTVKVHLHNVFRKLGISNRTALAVITLRHS